MKLIPIALAVTLISSSALVLADNSGFYIGGKLGASLLQSKAVGWQGQANYSRDDYDYRQFDDKSKTVFNIGINLGYDFMALYHVPIRTELDYTYRTDAKITTTAYGFASISGVSGGSYDEADFKIRQSTLMLNSYYDFYNSTSFTPYVGAGLGASFIKYKGDERDTGNISKTHFAWALMAGVSYDISANLTANLEYRYLDSGKVKDNDSHEYFTDHFSAKLHTHDLNLGLRYRF